MKSIVQMFIGMGLLIAAPVSQAAVWDVSLDFSTSSNTSGDTWQYRHGARDSDSLFTMFDSAAWAGNWSPGPDQGGWMDANDSVPYILYNASAVTQTFFGVLTLPAGSVFLTPIGHTMPVIDPPVATNNAVVAWRSPISGLINIQAEFIDGQTEAGTPAAADGVDWFIDKNNSSGNLLSGTLPDGLGNTTGTLMVPNVSVNVGDTILFILNTRDWQNSDFTELRATITEVVIPIPEPSVVVLLGLGGLAMLARRKQVR